MFPKFNHVEQNNVFNRILPINKSVELGLESEPKISDFTVIKELGQGSYGRVLLVQHNKTNAIYALKIIDKRLLLINIEERNQFLREVQIMYKIHHPNVVKLFGHFEDNTYCYLLMEYIEGGELFSYIPENGKSKISTQKIASIIKDVISAIYYMHHMSPPIMHRDIKPENILVTSNMQAKLSDFGSSNYIQPGNIRNSICGSPVYLAPEMITLTGHDEKVDIWSIGVLLFELLTGDQAWAGDNVETVKYNICKLNISWPENIDALAADLISQILKIEPYERISLSDILNHPFFTQYFSNPTSCLITPDYKKYKTFIISQDNPLTYNPYLPNENHEQQQNINSFTTSAFEWQTYNQDNYNYNQNNYNYNQDNYNYNNLFDNYTQNEYSNYNYSIKDLNQIGEENISWPLEEKNNKNGFGNEFSKNSNHSVMWENPSYNSDNFNSNQINYNSLDDQVFLNDNFNNSFTQSSQFVIPSNNNILGTSNDFSGYNDYNFNNTKDENILIENQLYNAYSDNNLNLNQFGTNLTFEQNNPKEFEDYLF